MACTDVVGALHVGEFAVQETVSGAQRLHKNIIALDLSFLLCESQHALSKFNKNLIAKKIQQKF
jgi:hypothetical protein